jgi:GT2 family glycosyltransferase
LLRLRRNGGFSGNVNAGQSARAARCCYYQQRRPRRADWVATGVDTLLAQPELGSVASKVLYADRHTINSAGDVVGRNGAARQRGNGQVDGPAWDEPRSVFGASGGAAAYRRRMLADVGLLDEAFFMYLEDVDLAFRAHLRGWACRYEPRARVYHLGSASAPGPLVSYYNGRNLVRLLVKNVPAGLLRTLLPSALRYQARRAVTRPAPGAAPKPALPCAARWWACSNCRTTCVRADRFRRAGAFRPRPATPCSSREP